MFLKRVKIHSFKSFQFSEIELCPHLNCITGKNGVGKSNFMDAILFALTVPMKRLRVDSIDDLISKSGSSYKRHSKFASVTLVFGKLNQEDDHFLTAKVIVEDHIGASIMYKIDGKVKKKADVRRWIKEVVKMQINFNDEHDEDSYSNFVIAQNGVVSIPFMSPKMKARYISLAAGTFEWENNKLNVLKELEKCLNQETTIKSNIQSLESIVGKERDHIENLERIRGLYHEIEDLKQTLKILNLSNRQKELESLKLKLEELKSNEGKILAIHDTIKIKLKNLENEYQQESEEYVILSDQLNDLQTQEDELQNKKLMYSEKINYIKGKQDESRIEYEHAMKMILKLENEIHQIEYDSLSPLKHRYEALKQALSSNTLERHEIVNMDALEAQISDLKREMNELSTELNSSKDQMMKKQSQLDLIQSQINAVSFNEQAYRQLKEEETNTSSQLKALLNRLEKLSYQNTRLTGFSELNGLLKGYYGMLYQVFRFLPSAAPYIDALSEIMTLSTLTIHITENVGVSNRLLDEYHKDGKGSIRIWPLDRIRGRDTKQISNSIKSNGIHVTFPWNLVQVENPILMKAVSESPLANWVIVNSVKDGEKLLSKNPQLKIITKNGKTKIIRGSLSGGFKTQGKVNTFLKNKIAIDSLYIEIQELKTKKNALTIELKEMDDYTHKKQSLETLSTDLSELDRTISTLNQSFEESRHAFLELSKRLEASKLCRSSISEEDLKKIELDIKKYSQQKQNLSLELAEHSTIVEGYKTEMIPNELCTSLTHVEEELHVMQGQIHAASLRSSELSHYLDSIKESISRNKFKLEKKHTQLLTIREDIRQAEHDLNALLDLMPKTQAFMEMNEQLDANQLKYRHKHAEKELDSLWKLEFNSTPNKKAVMRVLKEKQGDISIMEEKIQQLEDFKTKNAIVQEAIQVLEGGILDSQKTINQTNHLAWQFVSNSLEEMYYKVSSKKVTLLKSEDDGLEFKIVNRQGDVITVKELSGGEKTLLALCFLLSVFLYQFEREKASSNDSTKILLLDEVDAALDEVNCTQSVNLIKEVLVEKGFQVISISHHRSFSKEAQREIKFGKKPGTEFTIAQKIIVRK